MMFRHLLLLFLLLVSWGDVQAQSRSGLLEQADSIIEHIYYTVRYDTNYIVRPRTKWTLKGRFNVSGAGLKVNGSQSEQQYTAHMHADYRGTMSVGVSYLGLSLSASVNPSTLLGKHSDREFHLTSYGRKVGCEVVFQQSKTFQGWIRRNNDDIEADIPKGWLRQYTLNANGYYVFNHRRFSYPAAFVQSYIQKRSAGSWLLGASFQGQWIKADGHILNGLANKMELKVLNFAIGAGYGYNLVLPHNWLLHISAVPALIVYSRNQMKIDERRQYMDNRFPEVIVTGRGAFVHSWDRYFAGTTMVFNFSDVGNEDRLEVINTKWRVRAFVGMRL